MALKIISGGQTGADRAALDWAIERGIPHGGWCPATRKAEDGPLPSKYQLTETDSLGYRARTVRNVRDSAATLIVNLGLLEGGSLETMRIAERRGMPVRVVQAEEISGEMIEALQRWMQDAQIEILNVAGPRESKRPGIYSATYDLLNSLYEL